jgi:hypothetical protein
MRNGVNRFRVKAAIPAAFLLLIVFAFFVAAQAPSQPPPPPLSAPQAAQPVVPGGTPPGQPLSAQQLDDLVTPIALYPDPMLGEVLAASTYPIEIVEASQWVHDHPKWKPSKLMDEAKKQNWDPSVQGLVAFPDALTRLSQDINWTTALGNAFLAQQTEVMASVQRMRSQAYARGTLKTTPQQTVTQQNQSGQTAINIEPANPDMWYVPYYNPAYIWGPPAWGFYPPLLYPGIDIGWDWGPGIDLGLYFGGWGGWGWGGWGWSPNWFVGGIYLNNSFFHRYGFRHFDGAGAFGTSAWAHDPAHRLGVPYGNRAVATRFAGGNSLAGRGNIGRGAAPQRNFGTNGFEQRGYAGNHSVFGGVHDGAATRMQSDHGFSSMGAGRTFGGGGGFGGGGFRGGGGGGGGFHGGGGGRR